MATVCEAAHPSLQASQGRSSIRAERRRRGCPNPMTIPMEYTFDFSTIAWKSRENAAIITVDDVIAKCPDLFLQERPNTTVAGPTSAPPDRPAMSGELHGPNPQHPARSVEVTVAQPTPAATPRPPMRAFLPKNYHQTTTSRGHPDVYLPHDVDDNRIPARPYHAVGPPGRRVQPQPQPQTANPFQTAGEKLEIDQKSRQNKETLRHQESMAKSGRHGGTYHPIHPTLLLNKPNESPPRIHKPFQPPDGSATGRKPQGEGDPDIDPRLKACDPELISKIEMEIVDAGDPVSFDDIAGLSFAKKCVNELVIWPMARPDIFTGLRSLPKGLLLFGPPGTGKTLIGKAIATQSGATFFSISASSLTSKWIGEGEKLVRTLFAVAAVKQPSVIFIDEIDSLLSQRSSTENEASRRMKTEFLVQLDGAGTKSKDVILVVGATNRPQELDEAARRRFVKRLYIPLPSAAARLDLMNRLLAKNKHNLTTEDKACIVQRSKGFSGADVRSLCTEAAMGPIRNCIDIQTMEADDVRPISREDFEDALRGTRSSVSMKDLQFYMEWNAEFGSFQIDPSHDDT
ncbi:hypothetical protein, variant 1 [Aphanomyces invadans]|uniref:AAA+ ATPase domain-containing protein n=1 Tax=Aphanomyces invadans TaxID=157072 RepID=A0A024UN74_9STRA|nr:hypothetical protein, variant 1 [Aphanomyces invadans]ETW07881.1 hypothetical protein, variant 1 [Aphanomyces invadans]|eukprot:XP_008863974.1 hypothetical protein, variant 1 [Aphanomyces invadans]